MTLDHMWVMPVAIKQGIGSALFHHAITAQPPPAKVIEIESDPHAEGFYSKMGAETVGEVAYVLEGQRRALPLMHLMLAQPDAG